MHSNKTCETIFQNRINLNFIKGYLLFVSLIYNYGKLNLHSCAIVLKIHCFNINYTIPMWADS